MDIEALRARGVSPTLRGKVTNPIRRLLWPFLAPYFAALLGRIGDEARRGDALAGQVAAQAQQRSEALAGEIAAQARRGDALAGEIAAQARRGAEERRDLTLQLDALRKDLGAVAYRLASFEDRPEGPVSAPAPPAPPPVAEAPRASHAQCGEDRIVDYVLRSSGAPAAIRYLDIGAAYPAGDNNTFLFHERGGSGVLVEADPDYLPAYRAVRPRDAVVSAAILPAAQKPDSGTIDLLLAENRGWTSVLPDRIEEAARRGKGGLRRRITVPAVTIGEILDRHFAGQDLHLLSIDVEGLDDAVLRDIDFARHRPWIIVMETMGAPGPEAFLGGHGYAVYADTHVNRIFVRRDILGRVEH